MVGRQPGSGPQKISIGNGCGYLGVVVHEIGMANLCNSICFFYSWSLREVSLEDRAQSSLIYCLLIICFITTSNDLVFFLCIPQDMPSDSGTNNPVLTETLMWQLTGKTSKRVYFKIFIDDNAPTMMAEV